MSKLKHRIGRRLHEVVKASSPDARTGSIGDARLSRNGCSRSAIRSGFSLCRKDVDELAAAFAGKIIETEGPADKPWGMHEFALNGPDDVLVGGGWPTRQRSLRSATGRTGR